MGHSYPMWIDVEACIYNSSKSYGARNTNSQIVSCGSSVSNSEVLVRIVNYKKKFHHSKYGNVVAFRTQIDGVLLKEVLFKENKKGRAGEYIKTRTKLNRIQDLKNEN